MPLAVRMEGFMGLELDHALSLHDSELTAVNTKAAPDRVKPSPLAGVTIEDASLQGTLPPASWTMIRLRAAPAGA
jgi:alpha-N-arabinofuranosidase